MKRIICIILLVTLIGIPSLSFGESGEAFIAIEAETGISDTSFRGYFVKVTDEDASGELAMKSESRFPDEAEIQSPTEKPLEFKLNVEEEGRYKIYLRIKGQDSVQFSVNSEPYRRTWFSWDKDEYSWILLTESELNKGENSISLSARKTSFYIDKIIITNSILYYPVGFGQDIGEGSGITEIYEKPNFYPEKGTHPRVLLDSKRVTTIRKNLKHEENLKVYEKVLSALSYTNNGVLDESLSNNEDIKALNRVESNAFMYQMTGLSKYAETAISVITNYLSTMKYPIGTLEDMRNRGGVIFKASLVYDWCHDAECFTDDRKKKLTELIIKQAGYLECGWPSVNLSAYDSGHGWENSIVKDLFAFAIAVYDEYPEIYECVAGRVFSEFIPVANYHYGLGDFFNRAGDDYGLYRYEFELYMTALLKAMGAEDIINENQKNVAYQAILRLKPDNTRFRTGDIWTYGEKNPPEAYHLMLLASFIYKDAYLKQFFFDRFPEPSHIWNSVTGLSPMLYLVLNDTDVSRRIRNELPLSSFSGGDTGVLTARTSWEQGKNSDAMAVSVRMPKKFYGGHQHLDAGSFEVYYKGPLAIDSGVYNSAPWTDSDGNEVTNLAYGSDHDLNYHKRTVAHNSMLIYKEGETGFGIGTVNDGGQRVPSHYPHNITLEEYTSEDKNISEVISYEESPYYTYIRGDLTGWYAEDKVENYERSFLFWNFFDEVYPGALIVFDKVSATDASYKKSWLLHSQQEPEIKGVKTIIRRNENGYNGRLINETLLPENPQFEIIGGEGKEYFVDGKNYHAVPLYEPTDESGNYRVEISPPEENKEDYFLNVIQVSEDNDNIIPLKSELFENENFYGVKINRRVALFYKHDGKLSDNFEINDVKTYNEKEYAVCGLAGGIWQVTDGENSENTAVSESGGTLYFKSRGGNISITPVSENNEEISENFFEGIKKQDFPYLQTYPAFFKNPFETAVVSKYLLSNGYTVSEYGVMYSKNKNAKITDEDIKKFPANSKSKLNGGFCVSLFDPDNLLGGNYYLTPYVAYYDNGELKYAYGEEIFSEGESEKTRKAISWTGIADKAYSLDPTIDVTDPDASKILNTVPVYTSAVASRLPGNQYKSSVAFLRLDLSKLENINLKKPVTYNLFGALGSNTEGVSEAYVEIYDVDNSVWEYLEDENISSGVNTATDIESIVSSSTPVAVKKLEKAGGYGVTAEAAEFHSFDITDCVRKSIESGKTHLTLAITLKAPELSGNYLMRLRLWQNSNAASDITYYSLK